LLLMSCSRSNVPISGRVVKQMNEKLKVSIPRCLPGSFSWVFVHQNMVILSSSEDSPLHSCAHNISRIAESAFSFSESVCQSQNGTNVVVSHFSSKGTILSIVQFSSKRCVLAVLSHHLSPVSDSCGGEEEEKEGKEDEKDKAGEKKKEEVSPVSETGTSEKSKEGDVGTSKEEHSDKNSKSDSFSSSRKCLIPGCPSSLSPEGAAFSKSTDELRSLAEELSMMFDQAEYSKSSTQTERRASNSYGTSPISPQPDTASVSQSPASPASVSSTNSSSSSQTPSKSTTDGTDGPKQPPS